jgi:small-conductance mechanosensitive channel
MRYDENLNNKDFEVILSNDIARFIYNLYKFLGIVCIVIILLYFLGLIIN